MDKPHKVRNTANTRVSLSLLALAWERFWPAIWPATAILGVFGVLAALDVLPRLPGWLHLTILIGLGAAFVWLVYSRFRHFASPDKGAARRRLERVNNLKHRPLEALEDSIASESTDFEGARLWEQHQLAAAKLVSNLRVGLPSPNLIRSDPFALRIILVVALIASVLPAGPDFVHQVSQAASPDLRVTEKAPPAVLDAWITPPKYTSLPPVFLTGAKSNATQAINVPAGSTLFAQVSGGKTTPVMELGQKSENFEPVALESYRLKYQLTESVSVKVKSAKSEIGAWAVTVTPDKAPIITFAQPPSASRQSALRLIYSTVDDFGLDRAEARIVRADQPDGEALTLALPLPISGRSDALVESYHDLTPHPWAGLDVLITLIATDGIGQKGQSDAEKFTLPQRSFTNPVARKIVEERKKLSADAEGNKASVYEELKKLAQAKSLYGHDVAVYLALSTAANRLRHDTLPPEELATIQQILWDTALHLEDGKISIAERNLRQAEQALQEALSRGASDAEIERLMNQLQSALNDYLNELAKNARQANADGQTSPPNPNAKILTREDLQKMMDRIRELARSGARDAAQKMLSQMQRTLENMQTATRQQGPGDDSSSQMIDDMQRLTKAQQDLLNEVFEMAKSGEMQDLNRSLSDRDQQQSRGQQSSGNQPPGTQMQPGTQPGGQGSGNGNRSNSNRRAAASAAAQEALRRQLGELMQRLGELTGNVPRPFGRAEQDMRNATKSLRQNQPDGAAEAQARALDNLQQAMKSAVQQFRQQPGPEQGQGQVQRAGFPAQDRDPFGRVLGSGVKGSKTGHVAIPDKSDLQKSRDIRDELRRRAGDRERSRPERDYIDRLLKQF